MRVLYLTLFVIIADQISKLAVKGFSIPFLKISYEGMYHGQRIPVIGDFFQLTFVENPGMAFGIDITPTTKILISIFSIVAAIGIFYYLFTVKKQSLSLRAALALVLGGAIGNLIDRVFYGVFYGYAPLFYGKVVDFFDFDFFNITLFGRTYDRFAIFNVADMSVSIGVLILLFFYKQHQKDIEQPEKPQAVVEGELAIATDTNKNEMESSDEILTESNSDKLKTDSFPENHNEERHHVMGTIEIPSSETKITIDDKTDNGEKVQV